jgi:rare lipoprotein A
VAELVCLIFGNGIAPACPKFKYHAMHYRTTLLLLVGLLALFGPATVSAQEIGKPPQNIRKRDTLDVMMIPVDSLEAMGNLKYKSFKKKAHASYYADKFNGKRTASGKKFNNNKYTAAHRKFPFGTKLRITNEVNGKCVIVEVTDRGPFSKGREIDISKRAFMDIAHNKRSGGLSVTIEVVTR